MTVGRATAAARTAAVRTYSIADLPGLKWWAEPDGMNVTGGSIDSYTDKSGNGNTISNTSTNRPTVAAAALNGYDGAQFVAASSQQLFRAATALFKEEFSFGIVMRIDTLVANAIYLTNTDFNNGLEFYRNGVYAVSYPGVQVMNTGVSSVVGAFHISTFRAKRKNEPYFRFDRAANTLTTNGNASPAGTTAAARLGIGGRFNDTNFATFTFMAGFICNQDVGENGLALAEGYWKTKYPSLT